MQLPLSHRNLGNGQSHHLAQPHSRPHPPVAQVMPSMLLGLQSLERLLLVLLIQLEIQVLFRGPYLRDLGIKTMEVVMEVMVQTLGTIQDMALACMDHMGELVVHTVVVFMEIACIEEPGGLYGGSGMYGGMYNSGFGGPMGGYGMGGTCENLDPNNPYGPPSSPPGFWISFLQVMHGVVNFFGRISMLIDQNTQAFHMFMTALLQLFDRSGMLYGELARFVLRLLGIRTKPNQLQQPAAATLQGTDEGPEQRFLEGPKAPVNSWDTVCVGGVAPKGTN